MKALVLIPVFNEEKNLPAVIGEIRSFIPGYDIVIVNDGSSDQTVAVATALGVEVISHPVNLGYGVAVQTGLMYAVKKKYDCVLLMDGDGQHDARNGPALISALMENNAHMVIGSRFLGKAPYKVSFARKIGRTLFSRIIYLTTKKSFLDITSGFRAIDKEAVRFLALNYPVDFPDAEIIIKMLLHGFKILEVPAEFRQRTIGHSMFSFSKKLYYPFKGTLAILVILLRLALKKEM